MAETNSQYRHRVGGGSKPFTFAGDIYLEEEEFLSKLKKDAVIWFELPTMSQPEAWFLFRERGDMRATFSAEWKKFVEMVHKAQKEIKSQIEPKAQRMPQHYV